MRQLANVAYVMQLESFVDEDELHAFVDGLPLEPGETPRRRPKAKSMPSTSTTTRPAGSPERRIPGPPPANDLFGIPGGGVIG